METYESLLSWTYDLQKFGIKLGLSSTRNLLERLGNPHERLPALHIGGVNGKGSVAAMISAVLTEAGYRVGLYTSPHLVDFEERFRIGYEDVSKERVRDLMARVKAVTDPREPPTFFEFTTAMAFTYFQEERTDLAIMEVGLGGRLDATNVVHPLVSVITNISLEHEQYLGNSIEQIAYEKAGIIKPGIPLVTAAKQPEAIRLFREGCARGNSPFYLLGNDFSVTADTDAFRFDGLHRHMDGLHVNLDGPVQQENAALALATLILLEPHGMVPDPDTIRRGLTHIHWPGRFQMIHRNPVTVLDGAHNPAAMETLRASLAHRFPLRKIVLVLGIMKDKNIDGMVRAIAPFVHEIICTRPVYSRAAEPDLLVEHVRPLNANVSLARDLPEAIERAQARASDLNGVAVIAGSLFTVGESLAYFRNRRAAA